MGSQSLAHALGCRVHHGARWHSQRSDNSSMRKPLPSQNAHGSLRRDKEQSVSCSRLLLSILLHGPINRCRNAPNQHGSQQIVSCRNTCSMHLCQLSFLDWALHAQSAIVEMEEQAPSRHQVRQTTRVTQADHMEFLSSDFLWGKGVTYSDKLEHVPAGSYQQLVCASVGRGKHGYKQ